MKGYLNFAKSCIEDCIAGLQCFIHFLNVVDMKSLSDATWQSICVTINEAFSVNKAQCVIQEKAEADAAAAEGTSQMWVAQKYIEQPLIINRRSALFCLFSVFLLQQHILTAFASICLETKFTA